MQTLVNKQRIKNNQSLQGHTVQMLRLKYDPVYAKHVYVKVVIYFQFKNIPRYKMADADEIIITIFKNEE